MANTSPGITLPVTLQFTPGQGTLPIVRCYFSTDDVSADASPLGVHWTDITSKMRSYQTSRGRNTELEDFDGSTASVVLDNRDRSFDPIAQATIRPMNRIWLFEEFSGEKHDLFKGYVDSWGQGWDQSGIVDAVATVTATDETKVLNLGALPVTNPPRETYQDVVTFDEPSGYWHMGDDPTGMTIKAEVGPQLVVYPGSSGQGLSSLTAGPIVGESAVTAPTGLASRLGGGVNQTNFGFLATGALAVGDPGDASGGTAFAIECWFRTDVTSPAGGDLIIRGPEQAAGVYKYSLDITAGLITITVRNSTPTAFTVSSPAIQPNVWYHIVGTIDAGTLRLYINGVEVGTPVAFTGNFSTALLAGTTFIVGDSTGAIPNADYDEVAVYRRSLTASRVLAHYQAGAQRGFAQQASGDRIRSILDAISSHAPRSLGVGVRNILPRFMKGQAPLEEIHTAVNAEAGDSAAFVAGSGTIVYLAADHRSSAPYNTVQATFGDGGGSELPYLDFTLDSSESFLTNEWNVTREGGTLQTASDATSISRFFKRSKSISGLALTSDSDAANVATAQLAKYKDPQTRVIAIKPNMADPNTAEAVYRRELMDKITVKRRPPGGGSVISQDLFIQRIEFSGTPGVPPDCTLGVSPL